MTSCEVRTERRGTVTVVVASGEIDVRSAGLLRDHLVGVFSAGDGVQYLVVDLTEVTFMDSTALGVLVGADRRATAAGIRLTIVSAGRLRRLFDLSGLSLALHVVDAPEP